jgi:hypothetical protein
MNAEVNRALASPAVAEAFQKGGIASLSATPEHFAAFIQAEIEQYAHGDPQGRHHAGHLTTWRTTMGKLEHLKGAHHG